MSDDAIARLRIHNLILAGELVASITDPQERLATLRSFYSDRYLDGRKSFSAAEEADLRSRLADLPNRPEE